MTAQIAEKLRYQGQDLAMTTEPLAAYFELGGSNPGFAPTSTALWRGYVGQWEILDRRLYLISLSGKLEDGTSAHLSSVFPDYPDRVFAHWFYGRLRVPQGRLIQYVHGGYASVYEKDWFIDIERGVVVGESVRQNGQASGDDPREGYRIGPMTTMPIFPNPKEVE